MFVDRRLLRCPDVGNETAFKKVEQDDLDSKGTSSYVPKDTLVRE